MTCCLGVIYVKEFWSFSFPQEIVFWLGPIEPFPVWERQFPPFLHPTWRRSISFPPNLRSYILRFSLFCWRRIEGRLNGIPCPFSADVVNSFPQWKVLYGNRYNDFWKSCQAPAQRALGFPQTLDWLKTQFSKNFAKTWAKRSQNPSSAFFSNWSLYVSRISWELVGSPRARWTGSWFDFENHFSGAT